MRKQPESAKINYHQINVFEMQILQDLFSIWYFQEISKVFGICHPHVVNCEKNKNKNLCQFILF